MPYFLFSKRMALAKFYEKWAKENSAKDCPENVIAFLHAHNLINVENALEFIKKGGADNG